MQSSLFKKPEFRLDKLAEAVYWVARHSGALRDLQSILAPGGVPPLSTDDPRRVHFREQFATSYVPQTHIFAGLVKPALPYHRWKVLWDAFVRLAKAGNWEKLRKLHRKVSELNGLPVCPPEKSTAATVGVSILLLIPSSLHGAKKAANSYRVVTSGFAHYEVSSTYIVDKGQVLSLDLGRVYWKHCVWSIPRSSWRSPAVLEISEISHAKATKLALYVSLYQMQHQREHPNGDADAALARDLARLTRFPPGVLAEMMHPWLVPTKQPHTPRAANQFVYPVLDMAEPLDWNHYLKQVYQYAETRLSKVRIEVNYLSLFIRYCVKSEMSPEVFLKLTKIPAIMNGRAHVKVTDGAKIRRMAACFSSY